MKFNLSIVISVLIIASCASNSPMMVVDPASVTDEKKVIVDREECYQLALNIDLGDETLAKSIGGAALGSAGLLELLHWLTGQFLHQQFLYYCWRSRRWWLMGKICKR